MGASAKGTASGFSTRNLIQDSSSARVKYFFRSSFTTAVVKDSSVSNEDLEIA